MTVRAVVAALALTGLTGITFNVSAADTDANTNPTSEHFVSVNFQPTTVYSGVAFNGDYKTFAANVYTAYVNKIVQYETAIAQNVYNGTTTDAATLATYATDLQKYETDLLNLGYKQTQINALKVNNIKGITRTYDNGKLILTVDANAMKTAYADANTSTGAVTSAQSSDTDQTAIDTATTTMLGSSNYDNNQAIGKQSIAIGFAALADGSSPNAVALGANTQITDSDSAVALGANNAIQNSKGALAMGNNVTISNSSGAIVFGDRVARGDGMWAAITDNAKESVAIGLNAYTSNAPYAVAIGSNARAFNEGGQNNGQESVAIGHNARTINMSYSIAIGSDAQASDKGHPSSGFNNSIAIGTVANANTSIDSVAIGHSSNASSAKESIALGKGANVSGKTGALAIGSATTANSDYSISMGYNTTTNTNSTSSIAIGNKTSNNGKSSIAIGDNVSFTATSDESIVIGKNISLGGNTNSSIIIGESSSDGFYPSVKSENNQNMNYSVVIGAGAKVSDALLGTKTYYDGTTKTIGGSGEGTAVGNATWASGQAAAFGNNAYALGRSSIAIGNDDNAAYKDPQYYVSDYDGEHYFNKLYKAMLDQKKEAGVDVTNTLNSVNGYILDKEGNLVRDTTNFRGRLKYSPTMALGEGAMAIGSRSMAYADNATAIGALTFAIGKGSTALGTLTRAEGAASMAMGNNSYVFANNAIASGTNSQVLSEGGNAYGYRTYAGGKNSLAVGSNAYANVKINFGTKDGHAVFDANGLYNSDPSRYAKSILTGADLNDITVNDKLITADGLNGDKSYLDNLDDLLTADTNPGLTTAKAETTTFHGVSGVVVAAKEEDNPDKNAENSIVIGNNAIATASNAIAMGKGAIITDDATNGMALGSYSMTTGRNSVALGLASRATGINSMAVGTASSANAENALSVGIAAINEGKNSSVIGFSSGVAHDSENSIIFGTNSVIDAGVTNSIVIGTGSSIGRYLMDDVHLLREINTEIGGVTGDSVESFKQVKTDENKKIDGAMAIGVNARVYNAESTTRTSEEGKTLARENGNNAMAIGNGAEAWLENSVALGVNSETDYTPEQMAMVAWRTPGAVAASTDVNTGIISIGKKGMERRLVNVAAGAYDTDAVNVSQLMQLWDSVQREMNPIDLNNGVHFVATNFQQINSTPTTDYATKYGAQVTYDRFIRTLSEYKGYLIKAEYGGSTLTDKANTSYRKELTQLRNDLVNTYGISLDQLNADSKLSNFYGTLTENATDHLLQVNLDADGLHAKFALAEYALQDLVEARDTDISVLTQDGNYITGMTSDALTAKIAEINYDNSQALTEGSIAIGYNARVGEKTTDSTGATAIKGQKGGVAIGYEARNMAETDNPNGASVALGDKSIVTEADATKIKKGVYYTNEAKDGITATPNAGVVSVGTSTAPTTADGITYNPSTRRIINVAAGYLDTDAVNVSQLKSLAAQTIKFTANGTTTASGEGETATTTSNAATDAVKVGTENGMNFSLKGADNGKDITTTASGTDVTFTLNKATTVTGTGDDADKAVTSGAVNTAITTVNNTINALDGRVTTNTSSIGTLNNQMAHTIEVTGNTTPDGTSNAKSLTTGDISFAINGDGTDITTTTTATGVRIAVDKTGKVAEGDTKLVTGDTVNTAITNAKNAATTTLTEHADSPVTVTKTTADDGHSNYNVTFNGTKAAEQIPLTYKANGANSTTTSTVMLSDGLNFTSTDNLTASVEANGVVKYTLNKALTGISSISNTATSGDTTTGTTITLSPTSKEVNVGGAKITGLANGSADSDAVTYGQFKDSSIGLTGNTGSISDTLENNVSFGIIGADKGTSDTAQDITTTAADGKVTITLNKAASIASGNTQVATSGQVYDAVTKAKTKVAVNPAENGILTVTNTPGEGTAADTYTLSINQKTLESNTQLSYQASGDTKEGTTLPRKTSLTTGLNFKTTNNNLTATTDTDGVVTYGLSSTLTDITSITGPKGKDGQTTTMTFGGDKGQTITLTEGTKLTGLADGVDNSDAVNVSQLNNLKNKVGYDNAVSSKTDKTPGAAGKDGLDGKDLGTQIAAIREGEAGPMVYTDGEGNRVVKNGDNFYTKDSIAGAEKAADGTYYNTAKLVEAGAKIENGKVVGTDGNEITDPAILEKVNAAKVEQVNDVQISAVDPKTGEPKAPTPIGNVKSTIGLDGNVGTDGKTPVIGEDKAKTNVSNLVKGDSKTSLNTVATVGDLQAVAQAGLDFKGNTGDAIHKALGSTLLIKGEENANFDDGSFESKNLATKNDNGTLRIGMKKTPTFDGVKVSNGTNTVELKPGEEANTLTLTNGTDGDNSAIKVTNVAAGSNDTDAVNYSQLKDLIDKVGAENTNAGTDGKSPSTNPSGNDGLDGKDMGSQIQAIRDGEAGPMVYTDGEGNRVVKDGNTYYKKSDLVGMEKAGDSYYNIEALEKAGAKIVDGQIVNADGKVLEGDELKKVQDAAKVTTMPKAVDAKDVQISTVDPKTGEPKAPTTIGNVKSNYGYDGIGENAEGVTKAIDAAHAKKAMDGEDGKSGLLNAKGADLNKVVTVGDLQAAAQAGLDFTTNDKVTDTAGTIHKALGSVLAIEGKSGATYKDIEYGFDNMVTSIDGDKVRIGMKKAPEFTGVTLKDGTDSNANTVILTPGKDTDNRTTLNLTNGTDGKDNQVKITNIAAGTDANDAVNYSQLQNLDNQVKELQNGENGPMVYTDGEGNRLVKSGDTLYKASDVKASDLVTNDGTHYDATSLPEGAKLSDDGTTVVSKDGSAISEDELSKAKLTPVTSNVQISAVDPKTGEPKAPTTIGNVKSNYGYNGIGTEADGTQAKGTDAFITKDDAQKAMGSVDKDGKIISEGLLTATGANLNKVVTVCDLQAVAQAGLDFTTNDKVTTTAGTIHKTLGSTLAIEGKDGVTYSDTDYSFDNMVTTIDGDKVRIGMKKDPEFTGITLNNNSSKVVFAPGKDGAGNTSLKVSNGDTTPDADTRVIIDNIKDGESLNSAVTKGALDKAVEELHNREGVDNGTMVYTHEGKTLDRDGKNFYEKGSIAPDKAEKIGTTFYSKDAMAKDGVTISVEGKVIDKDGNEITNPDILSNYQVKPVDPSTIEISTVDPATGEPKAPQTISSVKSNYGYNGIGTELNDKGEKVPAKGANTFITKGDAQKAMGSVDKDGKVIREGLLTAKGADLNEVATVGDLQAAAQAGLDFSTNNDKDNKEQMIHRALGSQLSIKGKLDGQYTDDYDSDNLVTTVADDNTIQIAMLRKPAFEGITVENGKDDSSGKVDVTAVPVNGKDATEGMTINLAGKDSKNGTAGNNGDIRISGVADGVSGNDAVNYSQLKDLIDKVGAVNANAGSDAKSPANTPAGQDGLDGKDMGSQIQAIRDGEAGPMVYTDKDGNRLVNDGGTYYKKYDLAGMEKAGDSYYNTEALEKAGAKIVGGRIVNADGKVLEGDELKKVQDAAKVTTMPKAVNANDVQISTVDPKTGEPKAPTTIGNVKSNYGYNGIGTEADGKTPAKGIVNAITPKDAKTAMNGAKDTDGTVTGGLLNAKGADLNKVVTVGDLQAAAQAGLDFTGNSKTKGKVDTAHTTLGGTIAIQGGAEYKESKFSDKNISTKVDPKTNTISINIKKNPEFDSVILGQPGENGQPDKQVTISTANGNEVNFTSTHPQDEDTNVVLSGIKDDPTRRDTAITRGALEDLGILKGEVGPSHIAGSDVGGNLSNGDNLNDYSLTKQVQAQREGLSGNVVYTDAKGNRLVKAGNRFYSAAPLNKYILESKLRQDPLTGMWFNISDFDEDNKVKEEAKGNGLTAEQLAKKAGVSETQVSDIKLSAVNMSGDTNTPTEIGNIKSTIGLNKEAKVDANGKPVLDANGEAVYVGGPIKADAAKKAVVVTDDKGNVTGGLLNVSGSQLNTVATVGDLQAVAQAGLDITANANTENTNADPAKGEVSSKTPMHRTLGSQFAIKGSDNNDNSDFKTNFSTENIMTQVEGNIVRIGMKSTPVFKEVHFTDNGSIKLGTNQNGNLTLTQNGATYEVATKNDGFYIKDANGNKTLVHINNEDAIEFNKYLTVTTADPKSDDTSATGNTGTTGSTGSGTSTGENVNAGTTTGGNTTGAPTSDTTPKAVGTVDVIVKDVPKDDNDIANKKYVDKQIGDIINNFNTKNELEGQGTIAANTSTDKLAVSGVTVKQYLDDNYMTRPEINRRFTEVSKQANAGTAAAMAAAGIPQVTNMYDDNLMIGAGVGSYGGESAVAIGVSGTNDDRDITYKIATTYDSRGKWGLSAGIGFSVGSGRDNPTKPERKTMSERIDRLTAENKELRKANEDTLKALDEANKNHLMSLEAANKAQLAQLQESGQAKIDVINATSQAKLDAMKKANEAELDALRKANKAELDKLRASNQAEIKSLTEKNNQLQQQVEKLEAMMNQLMAQNQAKETTAAPTTK